MYFFFLWHSGTSKLIDIVKCVVQYEGAALSWRIVALYFKIS